MESHDSPDGSPEQKPSGICPTFTRLLVACLLVVVSGCAHNSRTSLLPAIFQVTHPDVGQVTSDHPAYQQMRSDCTEQSYVPTEVDGELVSGDANLRSAWLNYRNETINELVRKLRMGDFAEGAAINSVAQRHGLTQVNAWGDTNARIRLAYDLFEQMVHPTFYYEISRMMDANAECVEQSGWRRL